MADQKPIELTASDNHRFAAHVFSPKGRRRGAIVLLPDAFGATPDALGVAQAYAEDGFECIVPQLLDRAERNLNLQYDAAGIARGSGLASRLGFEKPMLDVAAAMHALSPHEPMALVGSSWGASVAFVAAAQLQNVACAVCYYGAEIVKLLDNEPKAPVLMHFASRDLTIPKGSIDLIRYRCPRAVVHTYAAQHGFNTRQRSTHDATATRDARERTLQFVEESLAAPPTPRGPATPDRDRAGRAAPRVQGRTRRP